MLQSQENSSQDSSIKILLILGLLAAFGPMSIDMYLPGLPTIQRELGATAGAVQFTLSAFLIGFALGQLVYGPLSDIYGRRRVLLVGIGFYIAASVLCALSGNIDGLILARLLQALGGGAGTVVGRAVVRDRFTTVEGARVLSLVMLVTGVAPLLAPLAGGYLLTAFGWRAIFVALAVFGAVCLTAVAFGLEESNPPHRRSPSGFGPMFRRYRDVLENRRSMGLILAGGFAFAGMFAYIAGTPFVYIELYGVPAERYGFLFGVTVIGLMLGSAAGGRLVRTWGSRRVMTASVGLVSVAGLGLLAAAALDWGGLPGLVIPLFFYVAPLGALAANAIAGASEPFPHAAGAAAALFGAIQFGLGAAASFSLGHLHDGTALPMAAVIAVCGGLSLVCHLTGGGPRPAAADGPP